MTRAEFGAISRLAGRTARREWKRTLLIVLLIAVPVAAAIVTAGVLRGAVVTEEDRVFANYGAADVVLNTHAFPDAADHWLATELLEVDPNAVSHSFRTIHTDFASGVSGYLTDIDPMHPLVTGKLELIAGVVPEGLDQIALSVHMADKLGVSVGDTVELSFDDSAPQPVDIVGLVRRPLWARSTLVVASPERMDATLDRSTGTKTSPTATTWLVGTDYPNAVDYGITGAWGTQAALFKPGADLDKPQELDFLEDEVFSGLDTDAIATLSNAVGTMEEWQLEELAWLLTDMTVVDQIPRLDARTKTQELFFATSDPSQDSVFNQPQTIGTIFAALMLAEVALVAATAYATGTRRRLRELGLLGASGATRSHLRMTVIGEGFLAGIVGSTLGAALGLAVMSAGQPIVQRYVNKAITGIPLTMLDVLGPFIVGIGAATAAAWLPARTASRVPTTTALRGRMPLRSPHRVVPFLGLAAVALGAAMVGMAREGGGDDRAALLGGSGTILMITGAALLTGPLVAAAGRLADRLRATTRLVVRDSARQRTRAASAVAAAMVVLIAPIMIGVAVENERAREFIHFGLPQPSNHVVVIGEHSRTPTQTYQATPADIEKVQAVLSPSAAVMMDILDTVALLETERPILMPGAGKSDDYEPGGTAIGNSDIAQILGDQRIAAILDRGEVAILGARNRNTSVTIDGQEVAATEIPVAVLHHEMPRVLVPPTVVESFDINVLGTVGLIVAERALTDTEIHAVRAIGLRTGVTSPVTLTRQQGLYVAFGATLIVVLLIVGLITALSATESDHDVRLMVAVGAVPSLRRRFLGLQAGFYVLGGAALAVPLGLLLMTVLNEDNTRVNWGSFGTITGNPMTIPWLAIGFVLVALPLLVGVTTALAVRPAPTVPPRPAG